MARSAAIRGMETVIKPVVMLVRNVMAVNCRITTIAWLCRTSDRVVAVGRIGSMSWIAWSAEVGCRFPSSNASTSCGIVYLEVAQDERYRRAQFRYMELCRDSKQASQGTKNFAIWLSGKS